jgi:uncharacterized protein with NRDE domain
MCLVAWSLNPTPRMALLLAANRDEFFDRPAAALHWWDEGVLGGRDLQAGGAWMLLDRRGRLALVTNVREPGRQQEGLPSRGDLPGAALRGEPLLAPARHGFNVVELDAAAGQGRWTSNRPTEQRQAFGAGLRGLSNAALETPWPKLLALKAAVASAVTAADPFDALWPALADARPAAEADLPATGLPLERERQLSAAFIRIPGADGRAVYGTRCSTLVLARREAEGLRFELTERRWDASGALAGETRLSFLANAPAP